MERQVIFKFVKLDIESEGVYINLEKSFPSKTLNPEKTGG